jgi:hypothetical protein
MTDRMLTAQTTRLNTLRIEESMLLLLLLLPPLLGCAPPADGAGSPGGAGSGAQAPAQDEPADTASPFAGVGGGLDAAWGPGSIDAHLDAALDAGIPHPNDHHDALQRAMSHAGGGCPQYEDPATTTGLGTWFTSGCTAGGWTFEGLTVFSEDHQPDAWTFGGIASFEITDPDGELFVGGGSFAHDRTVAADGTITLESHIGGTYHAPWAAGWMSSGVDVGIWVTGTRGDGTWQTTVDGGLTGHDGALYFDGITRDPEHCGGAPQGQLRLRDPSGGWYAVALEGCSGCGELTWAAEAVGEACPGVALGAALDTLEATAWAP